MNDVIIARALHVLAVVIWIGGVSMATTVALPAVRSTCIDPAQRNSAVPRPVEAPDEIGALEDSAGALRRSSDKALPAPGTSSVAAAMSPVIVAPSR